MTALSIIMPTVRRGELLYSVLRPALKATKAIGAEFILVNDKKDSDLVLPEEFSGIQVSNSSGSGAAAARNHGASLAQGKLLLFIDDDIQIEPQHLQLTLALHETHANSCFNLNWKYPDEVMGYCRSIAFGRFLIHTGLIDYRGWVPHLPWRSDAIFEADRLAAFYFSIEAEAFRAAGGFNIAFTRQAVEDDEFSFRLRERGMRLYIEPRYFVLHNELDKIDLYSRLNRLKTGAFNKRQAHEMGLPGYETTYSTFKKIVYPICSALKSVLLFHAAFFSKFRLLDFAYRKVVHVLIGTAIYEGYYRRDAEVFVR